MFFVIIKLCIKYKNKQECENSYIAIGNRGFDNLQMKSFIICIEKLKWQSDTMKNLSNKKNRESEDWWEKIWRTKWHLWEYSFNINMTSNILALKSYLLQI